MRNKTLVFTATYNEAGNIEKFLDVTLKFKDIDILIIDDNPPYKTQQIIENFQKNKSNLYLIKRSGKEGQIQLIKIHFNLQRKTVIKI